MGAGPCRLKATSCQVLWFIKIQATRAEFSNINLIENRAYLSGDQTAGLQFYVKIFTLKLHKKDAI